MRRFVLCLLSVLVFADVAIAATLKVQDGKASFDAEALGLNAVPIKFTGEGGKVTGALTEDGGKVSGTLEVALAELKTGMDGRDAHMREALGTAQHPTAKLVLEPTVAGAGRIPVRGALTLKGQTKPASGACDVQKEGATYLATCTLDVKLTDYPAIDKLEQKLPVLKTVIASMKPDVKVKVAFKAAP